MKRLLASAHLSSDSILLSACLKRLSGSKYVAIFLAKKRADCFEKKFQSMLTETFFGFSSSGFGICIVNTPFLNEALMLSGAMG